MLEKPDDSHAKPSDHAGDHAEGGHEAHSKLDPDHLFGHVKDQTYFETPRFIAGLFSNDPDVVHHGKVKIPQVASVEIPVPDGGGYIEKWDFKLTKFMILEVVAAMLIAFVFIRLAKRIQSGQRPTGRWWNFLEVLLLFIRDQVARPSIGKQDANKYIPYLWTIFFFVLTCNLLGMVPWLGSPTGAIATTGVLALLTFAIVIGSGVSQLGVVGFLKAQVPHMDLPPAMAMGIKPLIFVIEILGLFIKHFVLAIRLLANMMAGHLVLAVLLAFIWETREGWLFYLVTPASLGACSAFSVLEVFVAFLQAYIFTFLSALFIGMARHPH